MSIHPLSPPSPTASPPQPRAACVARFMSPVRDRAFAILADCFGERPILHQDMPSLNPYVVVDSLIALEQAFDIGLDIDEAQNAGTIAGFLDLVEQRVTDTRNGEVRHQATLYDFAAYRAVLRGAHVNLSALHQGQSND